VNPDRVWARNFRSYRAFDWQPQAGLTTILGRNGLGDGADSNGAGKSTLLEALYVALFGPSLPWGEYLTVGGEETVCEVGLEFAHADGFYRVRRSFDAKGRGKSSLDLERSEQDIDFRDNVLKDGWRSLTMNSQAETQATLTRLIGLSEATFAHSVHAPQGFRHFADPSLPPRERKDILADALGLDTWERLKTLAAADVREIEAALAALTLRLGALEEDLARKPELEAAHGIYVAEAATAARELAEAETAETAARNRHDQLRSLADRVAALTARRDAASVRLASLDEKAADARSAADRIAAEQAEIARLAPLAVQVDSLEKEQRRLANLDLERAGAVDRLEALDRECATLADRIKDLTAAAAHSRGAASARRQELSDELLCPTCEQPLAGEALRKAQASVERDAARFEADADQAAAEGRALTDDLGTLRETHHAIVVPEPVPLERIADVQTRLQAATDAQREITTRSAVIVTMQTHRFPDLAEREAAAAEAAKAAEALAAEDAHDQDAVGLAARELERASTSVAACRAADRQAQAELTRSEERLRSLAGLADKAQETHAEKTGLAARLETLKALERSYGRDGIPALLLETQAVPQIETEAQRVLEALGMPFRVELVTQRENKTGGLRDTLDVVVHEPGGARSYATYSGGERTRLELALRLGIARLIAQRSSSHCALLALDELPYLDRAGQAALVEVLRGLTEFEKVVVVSHEEGLAEAFDQAVVVTRDEHGSRLEEAA
jgi:exonuclease SbcC